MNNQQNGQDESTPWDDELMKQIWAVYEDAGGNGHNFLSGQAMAIAALIRQREQALLEEVEKRVVGKDEDPERIHVSHAVCEAACIPQLKTWAKDGLRQEQRQTLQAIRQERNLKT